MEQISDIRNLDSSEDDGQAHDDPLAISRFYIPKGVEVFEVNGPFFFGMAAKFQDAISGRQPRVLVLRLRNVPAIDSTGIITLEKIIDKSRKHGRDILLSGLNKQPRSALQRAGVIDLIGEDHLHPDINSALEHAVMIVGRHQINQKPHETHAS